MRMPAESRTTDDRDGTGRAPDAAASVIAMIGSPIAHAHLPGSLNARFRQESRNALVVPIDLALDRTAAFFTLLRGWRNCAGAVVTAPHKPAALYAADRASPRAERLGAANLLIRRGDGSLEADNLDGEGFVAALSKNGFETRGARVVIYGCGAAGSAIALALAERGVATMALVDKEPKRMQKLAEAVLMSGFPAPPELSTGAPDSLAGADLVINATALGVDGRTQPASLETVEASALVADVIANPVETPWLREAKARGCRIQGGAAMSEGQTGIILEKLGVA